MTQGGTCQKPDWRCHIPKFSNEFIIGTAIALLLFLFGCGLTLVTMERKTKREFQVAVGCFLASAGIALYGILSWQVHTEEAVSKRILLVLALCAGVLMGTGEIIRWAHRRYTNTPTKPPVEGEVKTEAKPAEPERNNPPVQEAKVRVPPIEKTVKFTVMIPFDTAPDSAPIPLDENPDDPLYKTYLEMQTLTSNGRIEKEARESKEKGQITYRIIPLSMNESSPFLGKMLRYYIFRSIDSLQHDTMTISIGYPAEARPGIVPPDAEHYPYGKLYKQLEGNVFFRPFLYRESIDQMTWKSKSIKVPKGTEIVFEDLKNPERYLVRFEKKGYYRADFTVENFMGTGIGVIPKHFSTPHANTTMQWSYFVTIHYTIEHPHDDAFNPNNYAQWLDSLTDALRKQLVIS